MSLDNRLEPHYAEMEYYPDRGEIELPFGYDHKKSSSGSKLHVPEDFCSFYSHLGFQEAMEHYEEVKDLEATIRKLEKENEKLRDEKILLDDNMRLIEENRLLTEENEKLQEEIRRLKENR